MGIKQYLSAECADFYSHWVNAVTRIFSDLRSSSRRLDIEGWVGGTLTEYYSAERSASNSGVVGVSERIYSLKLPPMPSARGGHWRHKLDWRRSGS
jgi:hypothetical protein